MVPSESLCYVLAGRQSQAPQGSMTNLGSHSQLILSLSGLTEAFMTLRPCSDLVTLRSAKPAPSISRRGQDGGIRKGVSGWPPRLAGSLDLLKLGA